MFPYNDEENAWISQKSNKVYKTSLNNLNFQFYLDALVVLMIGSLSVLLPAIIYFSRLS